MEEGKEPIQKVDSATGEIMCLVEVPATYKTVTKTVLRTPGTTRKIEIPAEYTTVRKQVMKSPSTTREVAIPAEYQVVETQKLVSPAPGEAVQVSAEQQAVTKTVVASEGRIEWQPVLCATNASPELIKTMQLALRRAGRYSGKIDGKLNAQTMAAVRSFQQAKGLPTTGQLTNGVFTNPRSKKPETSSLGPRARHYNCSCKTARPPRRARKGDCYGS